MSKSLTKTVAFLGVSLVSLVLGLHLTTNKPDKQPESSPSTTGLQNSAAQKTDLKTLSSSDHHLYPRLINENEEEQLRAFDAAAPDKLFLWAVKQKDVPLAEKLISLHLQKTPDPTQSTQLIRASTPVSIQLLALVLEHTEFVSQYCDRPLDNGDEEARLADALNQPQRINPEVIELLTSHHCLSKNLNTGLRSLVDTQLKDDRDGRETVLELLQLGLSFEKADELMKPMSEDFRQQVWSIRVSRLITSGDLQPRDYDDYLARLGDPNRVIGGRLPVWQHQMMILRDKDLPFFRKMVSKGIHPHRQYNHPKSWEQRLKHHKFLSGDLIDDVHQIIVNAGVEE